MPETPITVSATEFKAKCLALIEEMVRTKNPVIITKHGKIVAEMRPSLASEQSFVGTMKGTLLSYDSPFAPAADLSEWDALR
jgi:antitoxin (DNA-binding transcriptional repressor) of toxin-antitoxin stability system